jgi:DNA-directed RNA polymerase, mitochondrial
MNKKPMNRNHDIWHRRAAYTASMNKTQDIDRSTERLLNSEKYRTRATSFATTKQAQALRRKYQGQLAELIAADRVNKRKDKDVYGALKDIDNNELALRLMVAGINVSEHDDFGTDDDGQKNLRDQILWIGRDLCQHLPPKKSTRELRFKVGRWGIRRLLDLLPITFGTDDDDGDVLKMTIRADEIMDDALVAAIKKNALLSPLNVEPKDWTQVNTGGLPDDIDHVTVRLIREHHPSIENAVRKAIADGKMHKVLDAISLLQRVPFTINEHILKIIEHRNRPLYAGPKPPVWQQGFKAWSEKRNEFGNFYLDALAANGMACFERFVVLLNLDFRGRVNPISHFSFIREDRIRALFKFAHGAPIGEDGLWWLRGHVARSADGSKWSDVPKPSKLTRDGRVAWTVANEKTLRSIGEAVLRGDDPATLEWASKDLKTPYQFLAACAELAGALNVGPSFITTLPLMFDETCSGLQHLCAMTRAEEGKYVNLTAADKPEDFYGRIAERVFKVAPALMEGPDDREIVKQPVMSYFYGSVKGGFSRPYKGGPLLPFGMVKQVIDTLKERGQSTKGAKELAHAIYDAIEGEVPRAKAVRDFLKKLVKICAKHGKALRWTTILGLPIINVYHKPDTRDYTVPLRGRRRHITLTVGDKPDIDPKQAADAVTANFIHSLDATLLHMVAVAAAKEGIEIVTVHDCFGCIAPHAARLNEIIREEFVRLHKHNLLADVLAAARRAVPGRHVKWPPLPKLGKLDIEEVLKSPNAFR